MNSIKTASQDAEEEDASFYIEPTENPASELKSELKVNESDVFKQDLIE